MTKAMRETAKHYQAFLVWYELDRHYDKTRTKLGVNKNTLANWIKVFEWHARADVLDAHAQAKIDSKLVNERVKRQAKMNETHFQTGQELLIVSNKYLEENGIDNGAQAIAAAKAGVEIQRKVEGLPDWLIDIFGMSEAELVKERARLLSELASAGAEVARERPEVREV